MISKLVHCSQIKIISINYYENNLLIEICFVEPIRYDTLLTLTTNFKRIVTV